MQNFRFLPLRSAALGLVTGTATLLAAHSQTWAMAPIDGPLVESVELQSQLGAENLKILDIRNRIDGGSREAFIEGHIPGAVHSDYLEDGWRTKEAGVVGVVPQSEALETLIGGLGIDNDDSIVIVHGGVNATDFGSAARVYWTFKYLGHDNVAILNGGYRDWTSDPSRPVKAGLTSIEPANFEARIQSDLLIATKEVEQTLKDDGYVRIDARPFKQHIGQTKAPVAKAAGRIPASIGLDNAIFIDENTGRVKPLGELQVLAPMSIANDGATIVSYCNTGHWASVNWFIMSELLEYENVRLYDASMAGWTQDSNRELSIGDQLLDELSRWVSES